MRNVVGVMALLILVASPAVAQQRQIGVKAGPTFPTVVFDTDDEDDEDYGRRFAASFGGFLVRPLSDRVAAQFELLYVAKGGKVTSDTGDESITLKLDYVEVPVLARIGLTRSARRSFYLFAGPSIAVRTGASLEDSILVDGFRVGNAIDVGADFKRFELGLIVGGGVDIGQWVVVDARYGWGLTDINDNDEIPFSIKNRALTFMAGVRF